MDEYEKLETHMKALYSLYVQKFRNVTYIEQILVDYDKAEQERNMVCCETLCLYIRIADFF